MPQRPNLRPSSTGIPACAPLSCFSVIDSRETACNYRASLRAEFMACGSRNPGILGGTPVFRGTRVPIQALFDYLEGGETLEDFLEGFPTVSREPAVAALEEAKELLLARP